MAARIHPLASIAAIVAVSGAIAHGEDRLTAQLRELDSRVIVLGTVRQPPLAAMLARDVDARLRAANRADREAWSAVKSKADWEAFRKPRLAALAKSLGQLPLGEIPRQPGRPLVTGSHEGDGYRVDNLVYASRPGLTVTANLYRPAKAAPSMPAILLCHSHQSTKDTSWRQDMAMTWARAGCVVLSPDHLGHGERTQHPFGGEGGHDYHFRYDASLQLFLAGESLMGWYVADLMRGLDVLLAHPGVDPQRVLLISEPAGGGDVAAVTAALDARVTCAMVQNFGGPQPETAYPLPSDAEESFEFAGRGSWESTRSLRLSARDGFLPWTIVAAVAPRRLIYDHEFYWDREHDPVWKRLERVYGFYDAPQALAGQSGRGFVVGSAPENSHWLAENRQWLYPLLEKWLAIPNPKQEYSARRPEAELRCLTPEAARELQSQPLHKLAGELAQARTAQARSARARLSADERRQRWVQDATALLGPLETPAAAVKGPANEPQSNPPQSLDGATVERIHLGTDAGIVTPVLLLLPAQRKRPAPLVVAFTPQGKQAFLHKHAADVAQLLSAGVAVCLTDLRGTGESSPGEPRDRRSAAAGVSASEWMLGRSILGGQVRDLRAVLAHLRARPDLDRKRFALWGASLAKVNPPDARFASPYTGQRPALGEPSGGLAALFGALVEDEVRAVLVHGCLSDYQSAFETPFVYLPHEAVIPGLLTVGDVCDLTAALAPRAVWIDEAVDGLNRAVSDAELRRRCEPARQAYAAANSGGRLQLGSAEKTNHAQWLIKQLEAE